MTINVTISAPDDWFTRPLNHLVDDMLSDWGNNRGLSVVWTDATHVELSAPKED